MTEESLNYLCCVRCKSELSKSDNFLICKKCGHKHGITEGIFEAMPSLPPDLELSIKKWDENYVKILESGRFYQDYENYNENYFPDSYQQVARSRNIPGSVYLEIGCGMFFFGQKIASDCQMIIGIDFSLNALKIAKKMLDEKGIKNYLLIHGDILDMPIKNDCLDLIFGVGVIEHFKNTAGCVNELYRVLKNGGASINTVPYLNIGSLTYRQIWGNIPNLPILKPVAEFIHIKLLKGRHMVFGYEFSFLGSTLKKIHRRAGFKKVSIEKFGIDPVFDFIPKRLRRPFVWLAKNSRLFWPMVKVAAEK